MTDIAPTLQQRQLCDLRESWPNPRPAEVQAVIDRAIAVMQSAGIAAGITAGTYLAQSERLPEAVWLPRLVPQTLLHSGAIIAVLAGAQRGISLCQALLRAPLGERVNEMILEKALTLELAQFEVHAAVRWLNTLGCRAELWLEADGLPACSAE